MDNKNISKDLLGKKRGLVLQPNECMNNSNIEKNNFISKSQIQNYQAADIDIDDNISTNNLKNFTTSNEAAIKNGDRFKALNDKSDISRIPTISKELNSESDISEEMIETLIQKKKAKALKEDSSKRFQYKNNNRDYKMKDINGNFGIKFTKHNYKKDNINDLNDEILSDEIESNSIESVEEINITKHEKKINPIKKTNSNEAQNTRKLEFSKSDKKKSDLKIENSIILNREIKENRDQGILSLSESEDLKYIESNFQRDKKRNIANSAENKSNQKNMRKNIHDNLSNLNHDLLSFKKDYKEIYEDEINDLYSKADKSNNKGENQKHYNTSTEDITKLDFISFKKSDDKEFEMPKEFKEDVVHDLVRTPLYSAYPWVTKRTAEYKGMPKLHFEICDFYEYIKPHPSEFEVRKKSFDMIKNLILKKFNNWRVKSFGSFPNGIFLADSDVDIVVISHRKDDSKKSLEKLYDYLYSQSHLFDFIRKIDAKVPIIKLQLKETKINLDISADRKNGYDAKRIVKRSLNDFHALKPLLYVLKYFIKQKKLNETFTGGISSFLLFNFVLAFLQYKNKTESNSKTLNLGQLLVDFFQFYGFDFNYDEIGISVRYGGFFYRRKDIGLHKTPFLSIENFQDITQNIGSGSYKFKSILNCFKQARDALYFPSVYPIQSYLGLFISTDTFLRNRFKALDGDAANY